MNYGCLFLKWPLEWTSLLLPTVQAYLDVTHLVDARVRQRTRDTGEHAADRDCVANLGDDEEDGDMEDIVRLVNRHKDWVVEGGEVCNSRVSDRFVVVRWLHDVLMVNPWCVRRVPLCAGRRLVMGACSTFLLC